MSNPKADTKPMDAKAQAERIKQGLAAGKTFYFKGGKKLRPLPKPAEVPKKQTSSPAPNAGDEGKGSK